MKSELTDYHDWIEKFLEGKLSDEENIKFREMLLVDPEFELQYQFRIKMADNWNKAKEYEKTRESIAGITKKARSEKKNKLVVLSLAATFLLILSVSGIVMFTARKIDNSSVAKNQDSNKSTLVPTIKYPEEKASIHFYGKLKMLSPVNNQKCNTKDSIVFKWNSNVDAESNIIIENQLTGKTIYHEKIKINNQKFVLENNILPEGDYLWSIEGFPGKEKFKVVTLQ